MLRKLIATSVVTAFAATAFGQGVTLGISQVDASALGANYWTADVSSTDIDGADWWTVGGIAGGPTVAGVTNYYLADPNDPSAQILVAPGNATPQAEFATFVSLPRDQFSAKRFGANGTASIAGGYDPPQPAPSSLPDFVNIAFLQFPPSPDGADVPDSGYVARVTINTDGSAFAGFPVTVSTTDVPGATLIAEFTAASASKNVPSPLAELTFGFYAVPEPASLALLALGGLMAIRRR